MSNSTRKTTTKENRIVITKIFAIYDNKAKAYMQPFFAGTAGLALRTFSDSANSQETIFHQHATDFCLFEIGEYNDETAELNSHKETKNLGLAADYLIDGQDNLRAIK